MADLTPNNREEYWLKGMVDGQTTLEPNKRREYWYKEIVDAIGSGGGGGTGGGVTVLTATVSDGTVTLPCTAAELFAQVQIGLVVVKYTYEDKLPSGPAEITRTNSIDFGEYATDGGYIFHSFGFEISCESGSDIPSFPVA